MTLLQGFCVVLLSSMVLACGSGGSGGTASNSSSAAGVSNSDGKYSISLNKTAIKLDISWDGLSTEQIVKVNFKGDGLIVGYAPSEIADSNILIETRNLTNSSADVVFSTPPGFRYLDLVTLKRKLRFLSGTADGKTIVFVDLDIDIEQHDGFKVSGGAPSFTGTWGAAPQQMSMTLSTAKMGWTVSSDLPGLIIEPKTGSGPHDVQISYDFRKTPVNTTSAKITFTSSNGDTVEQNIQFFLSSPALNDAPTLNPITAPELSSHKQRITIPVSFAQALSSLDVDWTATLPAWLSAEKLSGLTGKDQLVLSLNPGKVPDTEGQHEDSIKLVVNVLGQPVVQHIPVKLTYEKYRLQANRQSFAFSDYGTNESHSGIIELNSAIANNGIPYALNLTATASQPWVIIDSVSASEVKFHLSTTGLIQGSHLADIEIAANDNPFVVHEKIKVGYYKTNSAVANTLGLSMTALASHTLPDKLRPWIYVANDNNRISIFDVVNQQMKNLYTAEAGIKLGSLAMSSDGQFLFFIGNNAKLYKIDLISKTMVGTFDTTFSYDSGINFYRINGKSLLGKGITFYDADNGTVLPVNNIWMSQGGMVIAPDGGAGFFEIDKGVSCGGARQINLLFTYVSNTVTFNNSVTLAEEYCMSSVVALSSNMQQFTVNRNSRNTGHNVNIFGLALLQPNQFEVTKLAELNFGQSEIMGLGLTSNGELAIASRYYDSSLKIHSLIGFYDKNNMLSATDYLPANKINLPNWFWITSDGKFLNYATFDVVTQENLIHTKNM